MDIQYPGIQVGYKLMFLNVNHRISWKNLWIQPCYPSFVLEAGGLQRTEMWNSTSDGKSHPIPTWATQKCRLVGDIWLVPYRGYHNGQQRVIPNQKNTLKRQLVLFVFSQGTGMGSSFWMRLHRLAQQKQTSIEGSIGTQDFLITKVHWNRLKQAENLGVKMNQSPEGVAKAKIWPYPKCSCEPFFCWDLGAFGASLLGRLERSGPLERHLVSFL